MVVTGWHTLADGVLVRRYDELDLSTGLVVGAERALVIDTRGDHVQGGELARAVREVTALPWTVVVTHGHFDHCFGTAAFLPAPVWAHTGCVPYLKLTTGRQRDHWVAHYRANGDHATADALAGTDPHLPDRVVAEQVELDLGGRSVWLHHLGRGHTDHDLVVQSGGVVFAGDLVEQGAPPDFSDAHPRDWPSTLDNLLRLEPSTVVPGHGSPVDARFVAAQRAELGSIADLHAGYHQDSLSGDDALRLSPYPADTTLTALTRV